MLCISAVYAVMRCLSVTFVDHVKMNEHIFQIFSPLGSHTILVFPYQTGWRYSGGNPPNGGIECRQKSRFWSNSWLSKIAGRATCQNIYRRRSRVYDTVGHAPLAIDRLLDVPTTKWQKQLRTTMLCRSHSWFFYDDALYKSTLSIYLSASECLWRPAAWTNTPNREQKRI